MDDVPITLPNFKITVAMTSFLHKIILMISKNHKSGMTKLEAL